jgi:hypothetical protein
LRAEVDVSYGEPVKDENDGGWWVPAAVEVEGMDVKGDGFIKLSPTHPRYAEWREYIANQWAQIAADEVAR